MKKQNVYAPYTVRIRAVYDMETGWRLNKKRLIRVEQ